ncbi:MAG: cobyric acid synthase [Pseudomonadota bacterium]
MFQGTGSDVGKSLLTAAFCRLAIRRGVSVAPFKPQNMSNNAAACPSGGEIGRAQAFQALAAGLDPDTDMNPVLLKPETDQTAQIILQGRPVKSLEAKDYMTSRGRLLAPVMESFARLASRFDLVLIEGAGSPAEVNLRRGDIANMGFARQAGVPVCLIGDIDRGGLIASLVGTKTVMDPSDAAMVTSFLVNKFRGNPRLFDDGVRTIETHTSWPCLGVIPWLTAASRLPAEDAVALNHPEEPRDGGFKISAPMLSRMANFDDADPLKMDPGIDFQWIRPGRPIPRDSDVIILFGTKSTIGDLHFLREQGWDHDIIAHARAGRRLLGLCGGYQMLGRSIIDPDGVDGRAGQVNGLGLLDVDTVMQADKRVAPVQATCAITSAPIAGYEIHMGSTEGPDTAHPFAHINGQPEGARSADGLIEGSYLHGVFSSDTFRRSWIRRAGGQPFDMLSYAENVEKALDQLADEVDRAIDFDRLLATSRVPGWSP